MTPWQIRKSDEERVRRIEEAGMKCIVLWVHDILGDSGFVDLEKVKAMITCLQKDRHCRTGFADSMDDSWDEECMDKIERLR